MDKKDQGQNSMLQAVLMAMLAGGAQEHENIQYNTETQARVPVLQAVLMAVSIFGLLGGVWLLAGGMAWVLEYADGMLSMAALSVGLVAAFACWLAMPVWVSKRLEWADTPWLRAVMVFLALVGVFGLLNVIQGVAEQWAWKESLRAVGGLALVVSSGLLVWRFGNELFNPLYPRPPSVDVMRELVATLREGGPAQQVVVERPVPYRRNGVLVEEDSPSPQPSPLEGEGAEAAEVLHEDFRDMIALVERAGYAGWAREAHVRRPHLRMPSGRPLTRGLFDQLVGYAAQWEVIAVLGKGMSPVWRMEPEEALAYLRGAWTERRDGEPVGEIEDVAVG